MQQFNPTELPERFWNKVSPEPNTGCWLWGAVCSEGGYGQFRWGDKMAYAHVVSYEVTVGPKPAGSDLDHLCRVRCCVNPEHLEPVSRSENCRRGETGLAAGKKKKAKTHCPKGHSYEDAYIKKNGYRQCRTCALEHTALQRAKRKNQE